MTTSEFVFYGRFWNNLAGWVQLESKIYYFTDNCAHAS